MSFGIYQAAAFICCRTDAAAIVFGSAARQRALHVKYWVRYKANTTDIAMVRVLNVAEKNDAAKSLSDIMSAGRYTKVNLVLCCFVPIFNTKLQFEEYNQTYSVIFLVY